MLKYEEDKTTAMVQFRGRVCVPGASIGVWLGFVGLTRSYSRQVRMKHHTARSACIETNGLLARAGIAWLCFATRSLGGPGFWEVWAEDVERNTIRSKARGLSRLQELVRQNAARVSLLALRHLLYSDILSTCY